MSVCRHCGRDAGTLHDALGVCDACATSPLCDACGHARGDHVQFFSGGAGEPGCRAPVRDPETLDPTECPCPGYRAAEGALLSLG
jgi:hypothetical protein